VSHTVEEWEPELIMWVDPGLVTGWATWQPAARQFHSGVSGGLLDTGEFTSQTLSPICGNATIGWEAFTIRPGSSRLALDTTALEVIGAVKWIAHTLGVKVLKPAQPGERKLGQKHLAAVGWHRTGPDHADAAAAHLLSFLIRERQLPAGMLAKIMNRE
jgi:hypothetical protein